MSGDQDHDRNVNIATYGFSNMSAAFIPRSIARAIWRFFLAAIITAGVLGASFEAMQCFRLISKVIDDSKSHPALVHHAVRKDR